MLNKKIKEQISSGSSGRVRGGEKHEIYAAAFGGHLFYDPFSQGQGGPWPPRSPLLDPLLQITMPVKSPFIPNGSCTGCMS